MLLCKVAVGRAYVLNKVSNVEKEVVPDGYDSFYLQPGTPSSVNYKFILMDISIYVHLHVGYFTFDWLYTII